MPFSQKSIALIPVKYQKKLEPITGIPSSSQSLALFRSDQDTGKIESLDDDERLLGYFGVVSGMCIKVDKSFHDTLPMRDYN